MQWIYCRFFLQEIELIRIRTANLKTHYSALFSNSNFTYVDLKCCLHSIENAQLGRNTREVAIIFIYFLKYCLFCN